ncbi:MAG TPA: hypothetical protein VKZ84_02790, partial [Bacteriovoracaceae bacterium]|nr:hypothetical protein [Bacteriovoracaceae bacterium]
YFMFHLFKTADRTSQLMSIIIVAVALFTAASGMVLNYFDFPAWAQPPHLFLGVLLLGLLYQLKLRLRGSLISN